LTLKTTLSIDAVSGHVLFLSLTHALCGDAAVNIAPEKTRGYLVAPPADFVVDGLFAEWQSPREDMDEEAVGNENVDITHYDAATLDETFFYLRVDGDILAGVDVPSSRTMMLPSDTGGGGGGEPGEPGTTTQEETPLPVQTGEDAVFIFLDTRDEQLGYFIDGVFYDKLVEVKGQNGEISSSKLLEFVGSEPDEWNWHPVENIHAASGGSQIEGSSSVDPASVLFHVVSWGGGGGRERRGDHPFIPKKRPHPCRGRPAQAGLRGPEALLRRERRAAGKHRNFLLLQRGGQGHRFWYQLRLLQARERERGRRLHVET